MRTKSFRIILLFGIIAFIIWAVLNIAQHEWLGWGIGFGVVILIYLFYSTKIAIKDFGTQQTKLMGIVNRKRCTQEERWRRAHGRVRIFPTAGSSPWKDTYFVYFIEVNEISLQISRDNYDRLSEGDEVCVSYWPNSKRVTGVDITKKVDVNTARRITKAKRKEAMESFFQRRRRSERTKMPKK